MDEQEASGKRRGFRFSLRDLFWVTVVVALATAWWLDHSRLARYLGLWENQQAYLDAQAERQIKVNAAKSQALLEAEAKELEEWRSHTGNNAVK